MSVNVTAKDISKEKKDSATHEELQHHALTLEEVMVKRYESLYSKIYKTAFFYRIIFFVGILALISFTMVVLRNPDKWKDSEPFTAVVSIFLAFISLLFTKFGKGKFSLHMGLNFDDEINKLEDQIVKIKLNEKFDSNGELKDKVEDFYIELNNLMRAKYETAFQFYTYEFYIYAIISCLIAAFFITRIL